MNIVEKFEFRLDKDEVFRSIDLKKNSKAYSNISEVYNVLIDEINDLTKPIGIFYFENKPKIFKNIGIDHCNKIVYCIITIGYEISEKIEEYLKNGKYIEALLIDAMADELIREYSMQMQNIINIEAKNRNIGLTNKIYPGNNDFDITYQEYILDKLNAKEKLNLKITENYMIKPIKSVSYIYGSSKDIDIANYSHECLECSTLNCKKRKNFD